jgi:hypothetical protein
LFESLTILWLLIELGKLRKKIIMINGEITLDTFIKEGLEVYRNMASIGTDFSDVVSKFLYSSTLDNIFQKKYIKKIIIYKDSTASVYQHLIRILGCKNEETLNILNINNHNK